MNKTEYKIGLYAIKDKVKGEILLIDKGNNIATFVRETIRALNGNVPLNDLEVLTLGEINPFSGKIEPAKDIVGEDWKKAYKFKYENKSENKTENK